MPTVIVAGAGIGGLTAALALARAGVTVRLFDSAPVLEEAGAGLQLAPNATRALKVLGLFDAIAAVALRPEGARIRRGRDGWELARFTYGEAAERRYGAPFLALHRADLQAALIEAMRGHRAITLETGAAVTDLAVDPKGGVIATVERDGTRSQLQADGLVGGDGLRSTIRTILHPARAADPVRSTKTAWRALVPADRIDAAFTTPETNLWLGPDLHLVHYPVRSGTLVNVVAIVEQVWDERRRENLWAVPGEPQTITALFRSWCREPRALVEAASNWRRWPLLDRPPLPFWSKGAVTLLGDAAHPMLPFLAQGASQAVEDAAVLGHAVERHGGDLVRAFAAYEAIRRARADRVQRDSHRQGAIYHLGGPAAFARDLTMRTLGPERLGRRYDYLYRA